MSLKCEIEASCTTRVHVRHHVVQSLADGNLCCEPAESVCSVVCMFCEDTRVSSLKHSSLKD